MFLILSVCIWGGWIMMNMRNVPPPKKDEVANKDAEKDENAAKDAAAKDAAAKDAAAKDAAAKDAAAKDGTTKDGAKKDGKAASKDKKAGTTEPPKVDPVKPLPKALPGRRITLGSAAEDSKYPWLITFNTRGGAVERVELTERKKGGGFHYADLGQADLVQTGYIRNSGGYIGFLGLEPYAPTPAVTKQPAVKPKEAAKKEAAKKEAAKKEADKESAKDGGYQVAQAEKDAKKKAAPQPKAPVAQPGSWHAWAESDGRGSGNSCGHRGP